jgi:hypothetical protein
LRRRAFRRFYLRPSFLLKRALSLRTINDAKAVLKSIESLFWLVMRTDVFHRHGKRSRTSP